MSEATKRQKLDVFKPILADDLINPTPLINVYVATIKDPKTISRIIQELNAIKPLPELIHLKRVKGREIILYPCNNDNITVQGIFAPLQTGDFDLSNLENPKLVAVAKIPPKTRQQYTVVNKLWPCNFHSNQYLEKLCTNTVFNQSELENHIKFMTVALAICNISKCQDGAIIINPKTNAIVAIGFDQSQENPIKHAVMVAIDAVARTQNGGVWLVNATETLILERIKTEFPEIQFHSSQNHDNDHENDGGPYLCTGFYVYLTREPCITCAMALVHSRAKRVFFGAKNLKRGGLGSRCKIHVVENLNHHYEVFGGLLEERCQKL